MIKALAERPIYRCVNERTWFRLLMVGGLTAAAVVPLGIVVQGALATVSFVVAMFSVFFGCRAWQPEHRIPWVLVALSAGLFFAAAVVRALDSTPQGEAGAGFTFVNCLFGAAYLVAIFAMYALGRLRNHDKDPTNLIDGLILAGGIGIVTCGWVLAPMLTSTALSSLDKATNVAFALLDLWMFFAFARLAIAPGVRNTSYRLLGCVPIALLASDQILALQQAQFAVPGGLNARLLISTIGCFACGAAALHPAMRNITAPTSVSIATVTRNRVSLTTLAAMAGPLTLLISPGSYRLWIIPATCVVTALTMARFSGLVRARERISNIDSILSQASLSLVSATDRAPMFRAALEAVQAVASEHCLNGRSAALIVDENGWAVAATDGANKDSSEGHSAANTNDWLCNLPSMDDLALLENALVSGNSQSGYAVASPLRAQDRFRGLLVLTSSNIPPSYVVDACETIARQLALAVETSQLSEDLHRRRSDKRFRALFENSNDLVLVIGEDRSPTFASPSADRAFRTDSAKGMLGAVHPSDRSAFVALIEGARTSYGRFDGRRTLEFRIAQEGCTRWYEATATNMTRDPEIAGVVINAHEITDRKALENDLRHRVFHDDLTGIPNRVLLAERAEHALSQRLDRTERIAALFVDIDDFKTVNDGLGHAAGDELLKIIAFRLTQHVREHDTTARLGGDEFAILLPALQDSQEAPLIASRLLKAIQEPIDFEGRSIEVTASIGIAYADQSSDPGVLFRNADVAMYEAKRTGKGRLAVFDERMYTLAIERLDLKADLARAIQNNELELFYQPLVDLQHDCKVAGFEALLRWVHPERGFVSPASFIPLAEETGLIVEIGEWVMQRATNQLAKWKASFPELPLKMSINLAPRQLEEPNVVRRIIDIANRAHLDPSAITLELTESAGLDTPTMRDRLNELSSAGFLVAADDFGSGFASYAALQQLPFSIVKIDRSLILGLDGNFQKAQAQLRSIIEMAHSSSLTVVAEGIEDERQRDLLTAMGCDRGQGYLFGRPVPTDTAEDIIASSVDRTANPR